MFSENGYPKGIEFVGDPILVTEGKTKNILSLLIIKRVETSSFHLHIPAYTYLVICSFLFTLFVYTLEAT